MKKLICAFFLILPTLSKSQLRIDPNFAVGFSTGLVIGSLNDLSPRESIFASMALGTAVGIVFENYQKNHANTSDVRTANWNALFGAVISGMVVYHVKNHFWKNKEKKKKLFML